MIQKSGLHSYLRMIDKATRVTVHKEQIVKALQQVYDPELPVDIYALGLIYEIHIDANNNVRVVMTLTSPNCPAAELLPGQVEASIRKIQGVNEVQITLTFEPPYAPYMMSEAAKLTLGFL